MYLFGIFWWYLSSSASISDEFGYRNSVLGKTINDGFVEFKVRETGEQEKYTPQEAVEKLIQNIKTVLN